MGFKNAFETGHGSGQWEHPAGGPYVFINEQHESDLTTHPVLRVADSTTFQPDRPADFAKPFTPEYWVWSKPSFAIRGSTRFGTIAGSC